LPLVGEGYQVMRPSRNRHYGHPRLIAFVQQIGREVQKRGWGRLLIGDLAQPRGGPMEYGHRSHQSGLDVDIWLQLSAPGSRVHSRAEAERMPMRPVVDAPQGRLDPARWSSRYADLIALAAIQPRVERIFVHPVIKQALCQSHGGEAWLGRVRPYWGHDAHFHVRLACPPDSPRCTPQDPVPPGDGCDEALDQWVEELRLAATRPAPPATPRPAQPARVPAACKALLPRRQG
jgi:penicillin-insensitive murein endopeptidase